MREEAETTKIHLTREDYLILVCWMENPANFAIIHGCEKKTAVGAKTTKPDAFKRLAEHLHKTTKTPGLKRKQLTAESMKRRWNTYKSKFTRTLNAKRSETGMGLTQKELKAGISIPAKLDTMCPHFARMESLFGEKHNVDAAATRELGAVIDDNPSGTPPTNEAESETSSDEESCAGTDICSDDERDVPAAGSDGQRGVEREAGSGVEREAEPHAPHAAPFAGARNDRRDDAFVGGADAGTGSRNAGRAADHVAGGATDAGGSSENNRAIDGDEPEFRFDSYSPPPPPSTANRSSENVGDRVQAEFEPEALVMYNELGLSDEDLRDLQSRLVAEQNCVVPDHQQAAPPHAARTNTKKQSQKRSSSKVSGSKKTSSKKKKTTHKRALIPTTLTERDHQRIQSQKTTRSSRKQHMETAFRSQWRTQRTRRSEMLYLNGVSNKKRTKRTSDTCDGSKNRKRPSESKKPCAAMSCS